MTFTSGKTVLFLTGDPLVRLGLENLLKIEGLFLAPVVSLPDELFGHWMTPPDGIILNDDSPAAEVEPDEPKTNQTTSLIFKIKETWPHCGVVVRVDHPHAFIPLAIIVLEHGLTGIALISSHASLTDLHRAIRQAMNGRLFLQLTTGESDPLEELFPPQRMPDDLTAAVRDVMARLHALSPQERAVARRLYQDAKSIALALGLSRRTVYHYMDSTYAKLGLKVTHSSLRNFHRSTLVYLAMMLSSVEESRTAE